VGNLKLFYFIKTDNQQAQPR